MLNIILGDHRVVTRDAMRAPHLFQCRNGDLLMTAHIDPDMHFPKRICFRSTDGGATWDRDPQRVYKEMAWGEASDGTVLAFERDNFEKTPGKFIGIHFESKDGGKTFEGPKECEINIPQAMAKDYPPSEDHYPVGDNAIRRFYGPVPEFYHPFVAKASLKRGFGFWRYMVDLGDRWLMAMQGRFYADTVNRSVVVESTDRGRTWNYLATIGYEHNKLIDGLCEPALRKLPDGSLLCLMRRSARDPMGQCRSMDGGRTWSEPELLVARGKDPDVRVMSNGVLAAVYCHSGEPRVMFSEDGRGLSWGYHTSLGTWRNSAMLGLAEVAPGKLLVVYDKVESDEPEAGRDFDNCHIGAVEVTVEATSL